MRALAAAALLVAFLLAALPLAARADVLDTDRVGSIELATNGAYSRLQAKHGAGKME